MKQFLLAIALAIANISLAQDATEEICTLYEAGDYSEVTSTYGDQAEKLTYKGLFHLGLAYYKQGKDKKAVEIMDKCISMDSKDSGPFYIKGKALNFMRQFGKAAKSFDKAIAIEDSNGSYYAGLGDSYMSMNQLDKALEAYQSATRQDDCPERPYQKIPLILSATGKIKPALEAYYVAKDRVDRDTETYLNILYKIGMHESMNQDYFEAKIALEELVDLDPSFYRAYPVLIQTNIGLRKFDAVIPLKEHLYSAYEKGLLKYSMREKFCFDQFVWENKLVVKAYERFESEKNTTYFKHIYEVQENSIPAYSVQTKHVPKAAKPYILQKSVGSEEFTYSTSFDRKYTYADLKSAVINVIADKAQPIEN